MKFWDISTSTSFTLSSPRQASIRETEGPSLGKHTKSKFLISEVPTLKKLRTDLRKRLPGELRSSTMKTKLHSTHLLRSGFCWAASTINSEERKFVVDSGASMHMVSKRDLDSAEFETMRISKKSDDGDDDQRRGANKRRSDGV